ncbi:hypothetical protein BT93_L5628 [Corymbia citriodora subsp. variegata]|uniref:Uncharacterized protein n=1 Tax=Corymbia citriodora subsp. variegata TaxID=360336 RepID=A0A8T0CWB9_CORYI|nr:hypothetical protein BT93_L5628 [Corymbia citriodora subsp. variegata]
MFFMISLLVTVNGVMSLIISKVTYHGQKAYAKVINVVEQTSSWIMTVASFIGEEQVITNHGKFLVNAYKPEVHESLLGITFDAYALAI